MSGIIDQITDGTGILLPDPRDRPSFGEQPRLLDDPDEASRIGYPTHTDVRERSVRDLHLCAITACLR